MKESTRLIDILEAENWPSDKIVKTIKYIENGLEDTPSKEEILAYINCKD